MPKRHNVSTAAFDTCPRRVDAAIEKQGMWPHVQHASWIKNWAKLAHPENLFPTLS